jgi:hypothetical protein
MVSKSLSEGMALARGAVRRVSASSDLSAAKPQKECESIKRLSRRAGKLKPKPMRLNYENYIKLLGTF